MCWDSDINWSGLEDKLLSMENIRQSGRAKPISKTLSKETWITSGLSITSYAQPSDLDNTLSLYDPACHSLRGQVRLGSPSNKISGV